MFLKPNDPTTGLIHSQGPLILHITYFITSYFFITLDAEPLHCVEFNKAKSDSEKKHFGDVDSRMNKGIKDLRNLHLACAIFLLIAKILEAIDLTSRVAKFLNQGTIFIYLYLFIESFQISRENYPFVASATTRQKLWSENIFSFEIECYSDKSGEIQYFLTSEIVAFSANVLVLVFMNINFRIFNDWKVDYIFNN